jgi:hypothetical protein
VECLVPVPRRWFFFSAFSVCQRGPRRSGPVLHTGLVSIATDEGVDITHGQKVFRPSDLLLSTYTFWLSPRATTQTGVTPVNPVTVLGERSSVFRLLTVLLPWFAT